MVEFAKSERPYLQNNQSKKGWRLGSGTREALNSKPSTTKISFLKIKTIQNTFSDHRECN
jgi:hypothetical protein